MKQRGRQSAAALEVVGSVTREDRPSAPPHLTGEQCDVWDRVVGSLEATWFSDANIDLLVAYCRHVVLENHLAQMISRLETDATEDGLDLDEYGKLLRMHESQSRAMSSLATRMRTTQQSLYDKSKSRGKSSVKRPWQS